MDHLIAVIVENLAGTRARPSEYECESCRAAEQTGQTLYEIRVFVAADRNLVSDNTGNILPLKEKGRDQSQPGDPFIKPDVAIGKNGKTQLSRRMESVENIVAVIDGLS